MNRKLSELLKRYCNMVQIRKDRKLVINYSYSFISQANFWIEFLSFFISLSKWSDDLNLFEIVPMSFLLVWSIIFIFLIYEPGTWMTRDFEAFGKVFFQCNWYALSIQMQRMYLIFASDTQNAVNIHRYFLFLGCPRIKIYETVSQVSICE